jgi:hypothetical protein
MAKRSATRGDQARRSDDWEKRLEELKATAFTLGATRDELMAHIFLAGFVFRGKISFLRGEREVEGREALVRVLANGRPLPTFLQHDLAALFSDAIKLKAVQLPPGSKNYEPNECYLIQEQRKLVFKHRSRNSRDITIKNQDLALFIKAETRRNGKKPSAKKIMNIFGYKSRQAIDDALKRHKQRWPEFSVK